MSREDYEAHKEDYKDHNVSSGAFVLIQDVYIRILEAQFKDAEFAITVLNENLRLNGELLQERDKRIKQLEDEKAQYDYDYDALLSEVKLLKEKLTRKPKEKPLKDAVKCDYKVARKEGGCDSLCLMSNRFFWNPNKKLCQIKDEYRYLLKDNK